jgi:hypothetical protein
MDGTDVGMLNRRGSLSFPEEARPGLGVLGQMRRQQF